VGNNQFLNAVPQLVPFKEMFKRLPIFFDEFGFTAVRDEAQMA
jgi:hypothetical protein